MSNLVISIIFAVNAAYFFSYQDRLKKTAARAEDTLALQQSIRNDSETLLPSLSSKIIPCERQLDSACESFISELLILKNRNNDYIYVLENTFGLTGKAKEIIAIREVNSKIDLVAAEGFGLSFEKSKEIGIYDPSSYLNRVIALRKLRIPYIINAYKELQRLSQLQFQVLRTFSSQDLSISTLYVSSEHILRALFWFLAISEVLVYTLVSLVDLWNNNVSHEGDLATDP